MLLQSESATGSPLVQTSYTQWDVTPSVQIVHNMNGDGNSSSADKVNDDGGGGGGGGAADGEEVEADGERPKQRLKLDPSVSQSDGGGSGSAGANTFGNASAMCLQQIPMVLLSQQLSAMNFRYELLQLLRSVSIDATLLHRRHY